MKPAFLSLAADACHKKGALTEGLALLKEAQEAVERTGERFYEAEIHRLRGMVLLGIPNQAKRRKDRATQTRRKQVWGNRTKMAEAEASFQQALTVARRQKTKVFELRAAVNLSQLWQQQGKTAEARALLTVVYTWFTEGFDTRDLQDAKARLAELGIP